jgi:hypothetical protein
MIDITKPVRTISGEPVTIISDKGRGHYPLLGYVGDSEYLKSWQMDGAWSNVPSENSIENYEPEPQPEEWAAEKAAFAAGKVIQHRFTDSLNFDNWLDCDMPSWYSRSECSEYRIKPEPQWVPLGPDDIVAGMEFIDQTGDRYQWLFVGDLAVSLDGMWFGLGELMSQGWQYRINGGEWKPCKKEASA